MYALPFVPLSSFRKARLILPRSLILLPATLISQWSSCTQLTHNQRSYLLYILQFLSCPPHINYSSFLLCVFKKKILKKLFTSFYFAMWVFVNDFIVILLPGYRNVQPVHSSVASSPPASLEFVSSRRKFHSCDAVVQF